MADDKRPEVPDGPASGEPAYPFLASNDEEPACASSDGIGDDTPIDEFRLDNAADSAFGRFALGCLGGAFGSSSLGCLHTFD